MPYFPGKHESGHCKKIENMKEILAETWRTHELLQPFHVDVLHFMWTNEITGKS